MSELNLKDFPAKELQDSVDSGGGTLEIFNAWYSDCEAKIMKFGYKHVKDAADEFLKLKAEALSAGCLFPAGSQDEVEDENEDVDVQVPKEKPVAYGSSEWDEDDDDVSEEAARQYANTQGSASKDPLEEQGPPEGQYKNV